LYVAQQIANQIWTCTRHPAISQHRDVMLASSV
jgi:hypothetical protein